MDFFFYQTKIFCNGYFITKNKHYHGSFLSLQPLQVAVAHLLKNMNADLEEHLESLMRV